MEHVGGIKVHVESSLPGEKEEELRLTALVEHVRIKLLLLVALVHRS